MDLELIIVLFSVPLFLLIVYLLAVFVLANYSGTEPAKGSPAEVKAPDKTEGADRVAT